MGKRLFLLLFASFIGIINSPEILTATDTVNVARINDASAVETVIKQEPEADIKADSEYYFDSVGDANTIVSYAQEIIEPAYTLPANNIQINGRTIELGYTGSTAENAGEATYAWYYSSGKFIYGHNSRNVFGFLNSAYDEGWLSGMTFTVNINGSTSNYTIVDYRLYDYNPATPSKLYYGDNSTTMHPIIAASPEAGGATYRMAIMTCYAGSSKRLVVFAN